MNSNEKITRIKKYTGIAAKVMIALEVLYTFTMACVTIFIWFINSEFFSLLNVEELPQISLSVAGQSLDALSGGTLVFACIAVIAKCLLCLVVMETVRRMLRDISRSETPFEQIHVKRMKRIAILLFIASFVNVLSIQANEWFIAAVVWLLAMVFDYGCLLQQEADETL